MAYRVITGSNKVIGPGEAQGPDETTYNGQLCWDADQLELQMVWDVSISNIRCWNAAEHKAHAAEIKREEIYREQEIRSKTVWGKEVDRHMFAWIEEFYTSIIKTSARNNITEAGAPITFGLKQLRDNRDTLLAGLNAWVNDPLKTADDIAAFDVVNWSGWTVARP